jgi:hypothetical protein
MIRHALGYLRFAGDAYILMALAVSILTCICAAATRKRSGSGLPCFTWSPVTPAHGHRRPPGAPGIGLRSDAALLERWR